MFSRSRLVHLLAVIFVALFCCVSAAAQNGISPGAPAPALEVWWDDVITVRNPVNLPATLPCQRIAFEPDWAYEAGNGFYKPCIAQLRNGDILVMGFFSGVYFGERYREDAFMYRSRDGGKTWSKRVFPPIVGREPFMSVFSNGDIMVTTHLLGVDVRNNERATTVHIHRSSDQGVTWNVRKIREKEVPGYDPESPQEICSSRNVLELKDGTRIFGLSTMAGPKDIWRSKDGGRTWDVVRCKYPGIDESNIMMWETYMWQARNGDILGLYRVFSNKFPLKSKPKPPSDEDQYHGIVVFRSKDGGVTWTYDSDLGSDYGEMYPSILRLQDGRLLCNISQRGFNPKGLHAALGVEYDDGFKFNFDSDVIMLDMRTPDDKFQGGGFGNTIQTPDGTLITPYSYRGADDKLHVEVVKWMLPSLKQERSLSDYTNDDGTRPTGMNYGSDDSSAMRKALADGPGTVRIGPGHYRFGGIRIPSDIRVIGSGSATIVHALDKEPYIFVQEGADRWEISSLILEGSATGDWKSRADKESGGILVSKCGAYSLDDLIIKNFDGAGIRMMHYYDCSGRAAAGGSLRNIICTKNHTGVNFDIRAEYINAVSLECYHNIVGCSISSGNVKITASNFGRNIDGLVVQDKENGSHGAVSNTLMNHNERNALLCRGVQYGMAFDNCCIFYGDIRIENSKGVSITDGIIGSSIFISGGGANRIADNYVIPSQDMKFEFDSKAIVEDNFTEAGPWDMNRTVAPGRL